MTERAAGEPSSSLGPGEHFPVVSLDSIVEVITPKTHRLVPDDGSPVAPGHLRMAVAPARAVQPDGQLDLDGVDTADVPEADPRILRQGDLLVRLVYGTAQTLRVGHYRSGLPAAAAGANTAVLRPRQPMRPGDELWLTTYLQSRTVSEWLLRQSPLLRNVVRIPASALRGLPVPQADPATLGAIVDLHRAVALFGKWRTEAHTAATAIFDSNNGLAAGRARMLSDSIVLRQRAAAASALDDLPTRLRTRMPYPVALRWRSAEAADPDAEGYAEVLEAAEALLCYAAVVAHAHARAVAQPLKYFEQIASRALKRGLSIGLGDWTGVLNEVQTAKAFRSVPSDAPFVEIQTMLASPDAEAARARMAARRNDISHMRRLRGPRLRAEFEAAREDLLALMRASEVLQDFPLRQIETADWDALSSAGSVRHRELIGDHSVVPAMTIPTDERLEQNSLYLADRTGRHHLLRPVLIGQGCRECGHFHTFVLDKVDRRTAVPTYRALEGDHTIDDPSQATALRLVGLLPPAPA
jgi:hypothetical protein